MAIAPWELAEVTRANDSGLKPIVFVHGLWMLGSSWQPWRDLFEANGYTTIAPGWPDDPESVAAGRASDKRAQFISLLFVCGNLGMAVPVIGAGVVASLGSPEVAHLAFAGVIAALSLGALAFGLISRD